MKADPDSYPRQSRGKVITVIVMTFLILIPAGIGFGRKVYEFFTTILQEPAAKFAIVPVLNYLVLAAGFLCLLIWAAFNGMFHNIEAPKYRMLEQEASLDQAEKKRLV